MRSAVRRFTTAEGLDVLAVARDELALMHFEDIEQSLGAEFPEPYFPGPVLLTLAHGRPDLAFLIYQHPAERAFYAGAGRLERLMTMFPEVTEDEWRTLFAHGPRRFEQASTAHASGPRHGPKPTT